MTAQRRMALAFCCMMVAVVLFNIPVAILAIWRSGWDRVHFLAGLIYYAGFAFPGWLISLPFIFLFKDANGGKAWWILGIGTAIGPAFIRAWMLSIPGHQFNWRSDGGLIAVSVAIAFLTSLLYVIAMRYFEHRRAITATWYVP